MIHKFECTAKFDGGYHGIGSIDNRNLKTAISIPKEMDGPDVGTNPDELLLSAAVTCFTITLSSFLHKNNIPVSIDYINAEGFVEKERDQLYYRAIHYNVYLKTDDQIDDKKLIRYVNKAEQHCMITRALKGNVTINIENIFLDNNILK
ncbi:hypothetical protein ETI05_01085 [Macrococcoides canis]|uniref:OsmC family protein n=1 Tax=Macrococcoides canis TaxID=1855823 RepID=UPI001061F806|nr:OsmC family protein [Macrococcus canis]MEE1107910.1 OsmC family protein [Macrococcus canis]TDM21364.1 hypothetical protein ETI05_01085 [Macrococcus canis]TDM38538.1 hypothetical protein ETI11_03870 [Macrococcus canis]TDM42983.1 hypothetical protein ETI09_01045 [Macrococcus canis]